MQWDYSGLSSEEAAAYMRAIDDGEDLRWCFGEESLTFILRNYKCLAKAGQLEASWISPYLHTSDFEQIGFGRLKAIFGVCDRHKLQAMSVPVRKGIQTERISLFRGCAGPTHTKGMSWTPSLDKAIFYAKWHAEWHATQQDPGYMAVYATTVHLDEVYCRLDRNEDEFVVVPQNAWRIDVPDAEFRLDRPRH